MPDYFENLKMTTQKKKNNLKKLGANIKKLREKEGLSFREFANICGIDHSKISKIEKGQKNISFLTILRFAEALGVHPMQLLENEFE